MTTIEARGQRMKQVEEALTRISRNPMEVMTKVRLNALSGAVRKIWAAWWGELDPVIRRHTEQPKGEPTGIDASHPAWGAFCADDEATDLLSQELTVDVTPLRLSEIVAAEERADRKGKDFEIRSEDIAMLMGLGVIEDDVSELDGMDEAVAVLEDIELDPDEAPEEPNPKKKPPRKKRS